VGRERGAARCGVLALALVLVGCSADGPPTAVGTTEPAPAVTTTPPAIPTVAPTTAAPTPRPSPTRTPTAPRSAAPAPAGYTSRTVTAADLPSSWRRGCPVAPSQLRMLTVPYLGFDGAEHRGRIVVHQRVAADVGRTFVRLRNAQFPIRSIRVIDEFDGSDDASMAADNTSGFNCRAVVGGSGGWSQHAYGLAIDINPRENPYVYDGNVEPPEGRPYVDRSPVRKGMIAAGGPVTRAFAAIGWSWGGRWSSSKDYQHFSASGR
jgi:hypothetical protein